MSQHNVFITGGTGYIGQRLIPLLTERGHRVRALVRKGSEKKLSPGCEIVEGNALDKSSFADKVEPSDTFIQLVGVPHPAPSKAEQFRTIDLASVRASVPAAVEAKIQHFIYVSVAHPAPVMQAYNAVRIEGESLIRSAGLNATVLRPWYVLGPGHWWPYAVLPVFWVCELIPSTRASARRLIPVKLKQVLSALVHAVDNPPAGMRILEVPEIRKG